MLDGKWADWTLSTDEILSLQLVSGAALGVTESMPLPRCDVSSLELDVEKFGFS